MTIKRFAGDKFSGLSTDTKPTNITSGATFYELDTGIISVYDGTGWQQSSGTINWGAITGTLSTQTDLQSALNGKSNTGHTHTLANVTDSGAAASKGVTGNDNLVVTGTAGVNGNLGEWDANGDLVDSGSAISDLAAAAHNHSVGSLTGVTITSPANGQALIYNTGVWENRALVASDIASGTFANARISEASVTQHEGAIDHDALTGFVANEHINHSGVSVNAGVGLSGGGSIATSRTIDLDINSLTVLSGSPAATDTFALYDVTATGIRKATFGTIESALNITHSQITDFDPANYVPTSQLGANSGVATLDSGGKVPTSQMPPLALTDIHVVADITARNAITPKEEGDVAIVTDASADSNIDSGGASYVWDGTAWERFKTPNDVSLTPGGATGNVQVNDGSGGITGYSNLNWDNADSHFELTGSIKLKEGGTVATPARGEVLSYIETEVVSTDTITRVMQRLSNGDDVIIASFVEAT